MIRKALNIFIYLTLPVMLLSCADDFLYKTGVVGEGIASVNATVNFHPLITTVNNADSRGQSGSLLSQIDNLTVFIYDAEDNIFDIVPQSELEGLTVKERGEEGSNTDMPNDAGGKPKQAEASTARATFTIRDIPFGRYRMYCVANMGLIEDNDANREKYAHSADLRNEEVQWNEGDIADNAEMFGYFTFDGNDTNTSKGFDAPLLTLSSQRTDLHSWIKRAASKVTLVYDGRGLKSDITIYIKSVTIKDIPRYCKIGNDNTLTSLEPDSMIATGDCIYYNKNGNTPSDPGKDYHNWLEINNGIKAGAMTVSNGDTITHPETAEALYFYENMQGDFSKHHNKKFYNKRPDWNNVGFVPTDTSQYDYKDNVPFGTYIEVEAYYDSQNPNQISDGPILYRYMLGQNDTYDYNAIRNHHYKLTLGFRGYANQPDWHIVYEEPVDTFYNDPTYYVSYVYNTPSVFPIRFTGSPEEFEVEIVENNWAPYDPSSTSEYKVPKDSYGSGKLDFKWAKIVYENKSTAGVIGSGGYYYGLQQPYTTDGEDRMNFTAAEISAGAPRLVTPIWAGFLALQVPDDGLQAAIETLAGDGPTSYQGKTKSDELKDYFYGKGYGNDKPQNIRKFTKADLTFDGWTEGTSITKKIAEGTNNECKITKAADGSVTIKLPMWTRPKSMLGISGFSGTNPYEYFQRKAIVKLSAKFKDDSQPIVKFMPVYQSRRILNPRGIWHDWDNNDDFHVTLYEILSPDAKEFSTLISEGAWSARIKKFSEGSDGFIELGGGSAEDANGAILGSTNTPVDFVINFKNKGAADKSHCAIIEVLYNGFTCTHTILVRQGYNEPMAVVEGGDYPTTKWSSFTMFKTDITTHKSGIDNYIGWDKDKTYYGASLCVSPIALPTLFKRANYTYGILASNNAKDKLPAYKAPGTTSMEVTNGTPMKWSSIDGFSFLNRNQQSTTDRRSTFIWARFKIKHNGQERNYRLPNYADFNALRLGANFGIGVLYADGATAPSDNFDVAYGYTDMDNDGIDDTYPGTVNKVTKGGRSGMRGFMVFNPDKANQIFFPIGASGMGRRTINNASGNNAGVLRYTSVPQMLDVSTSAAGNSYRPIVVNMEAALGAIYWMETAVDTGSDDGLLLGWDMNYFDMNFSGDPGTSCCRYDGGDALPIKLVIDD